MHQPCQDGDEKCMEEEMIWYFNFLEAGTFSLGAQSWCLMMINSSSHEFMLCLLFCSWNDLSWVLAVTREICENDV